MKLSTFKRLCKKYFNLNNNEINNIIKLSEEIDTNVGCNIKEELNNWSDSYKKHVGRTIKQVYTKDDEIIFEFDDETEFKMSFDFIIDYLKNKEEEIF
jgi:hypothetical protein